MPPKTAPDPFVTICSLTSAQVQQAILNEPTLGAALKASHRRVTLRLSASPRTALDEADDFVVAMRRTLSAARVPLDKQDAAIRKGLATRR